MGSEKKEGSVSYKRILLKLSGEALAGEKKKDIDPEIISKIAKEVRDVTKMGIQVALVIGAGNIFRGSMGESLGIKRVTGDQMGMLATVMNALAMKNELEKLDVDARVLSAIEIKGVTDPYVIEKANDYLKENKVVIAAGGTGHPYFTTDTAASLRAIELEADVLLKATRVDGVYSADPEKDSSAQKFDDITYLDVIKDSLRVMDLTAISLCRDNKMPIIVFNLFDEGSLEKIIAGERIGTKIS